MSFRDPNSSGIIELHSGMRSSSTTSCLGYTGLERCVIYTRVVTPVFTRANPPPPKKKGGGEIVYCWKWVSEHLKLITPNYSPVFFTNMYTSSTKTLITEKYFWEKTKKEEERVQARVRTSIPEEHIFFLSHSKPKVLKSNPLTIAPRLSPNSGRIKDW